MDDASSRRVEMAYTNGVDLTETSSRRFNSWEEQCLLDAEADATAETLYSNEQRNVDQKLWLMFQNTASAIAQLYKDRAQGRDDGIWVTFQNAAEIATNMYKESMDGSRRVSDLALQCGYQRRNKELLAWIKKRRKHVRREDLIGFLCGRSPPHKMPRSNSCSRSPSVSNSPSSSSNQLQTFHDAVLMNGLNGAMAGINFNGEASLRRTNSPARSCQQSFPSDLTDFISEEMKRRSDSVCIPSGSRKRHNSLHDVKPSSPKRRK